MSVAVSRQPTSFSPISTPHRRMPAPRAPSSAPAAIVPGLIRLQAGTTTSNSPQQQRPSRSRQRKQQQNRQSQDGTPHAFSQVDYTLRDTPKSNNGLADSALLLQSSKERTSPKRASQQAQARHQQQPQSAKKQMPQKQPVMSATTQQQQHHRTPPRSPTRSRNQPRARSQRPNQEIYDMSLSSADDSDDAAAPLAAVDNMPSPPRAMSAPTAVAAEPAGRLARSRRGHSNKDKVSTTAAASDPSLSTVPSASIPIARHHGRPSGHARTATATDPFLSRSVPSGNALPDWDLPPPSFGSSTSDNSSSDLTTTTMATNMHQLSQSMSQLPMPSAFGQQQQQAARPAPRPVPSGALSEQRILVPWIETLEDEEERAAALGASAPLVWNNRPLPATGIHGSPAPSTPSRPAFRNHARTASVPSLGTSHHHVFNTGSGSPSMGSSTPPRRGESTERANKYANGRFQSAPAPTFLPMPSFQA